MSSENSAPKLIDIPLYFEQNGAWLEVYGDINDNGFLCIYEKANPKLRLSKTNRGKIIAEVIFSN